MANLGETSRMVFKAMVEINRLQLPVQDRFKSLEALREPGALQGLEAREALDALR